MFRESKLPKRQQIGVQHTEEFLPFGRRRTHIESGLYDVVGVSIADHEDDDGCPAGTDAGHAVVVDRLEHGRDDTHPLLGVAKFEEFFNNITGKLLPAQSQNSTGDNDTEQALAIFDAAVLQHVLDDIIAVLIVQQDLVAGHQGVEDVTLLRLNAVLKNALKDAAAVGMAREGGDVLHNVVDDELDAVPKEVGRLRVALLQGKLGLVAQRFDRLLHDL